MTPENFVYWLQGFVEMNGQTNPTPEQWASICEHLKTVFTKVTPQVPSFIPIDNYRYEILPAPSHPKPPYEVIC